MPSLETIQQELGKAQPMDDFFGKEGIFARLFAEILEQMLDAELYCGRKTGQNYGLIKGGYSSARAIASNFAGVT
jgi:hypothetical protein